MKKIISIMFIALMCAVGLSSCASNDDAVVDNITTSNLVGKYVSEVCEEDASSVTYTLNGDMTFTAVEVDLETNKVDETWSGKWSFNKDKMEITFMVYEDDDVETYTAHVSSDYKSFSIIYAEDSEYEVYNKVK